MAKITRPLFKETVAFFSVAPHIGASTSHPKTHTPRSAHTAPCTSDSQMPRTHSSVSNALGLCRNSHRSHIKRWRGIRRAFA